METHDLILRALQRVAGLIDEFNQALYIHRARGKQTVKVTCDSLKFGHIHLRWSLHSSKHFFHADVDTRS